MRVNCVICTDLFISSSDISVTECGHLFHSHCIIQWLERSKTCPQCRRKTQDKKLIKVFLDCCESTLDGPEPSQLQNELEGLRFRLVLKTTESKKAEEENQKLKQQHAGLREEVKKLEKANRNKDDTITAMKMQLQCFGDIAREKQKARDECDKLRGRLRLLSNVEAVVNQSSVEVKEMLSAYSSDNSQAAKDMATYCLMLKKELSRSMEERRQYGDDRHKLRSSLQQARADGQRLQRHVEQLEAELANAETELASLDDENKQLGRQVKALEASVVSPSGDPRNSALTRLLSERPTPADLRSRPVLTDPDVQGKSVPETSRLSASQPAGSSAGADPEPDTPRLALRSVPINSPSAADGRSPRLRLKSASVAARHRPAGGRNPFAAPARTSTDLSRLKNTNLLTQNLHRADFAARAGRTAPAAPRKRPADCGWDGFGGSSKPDVFPRPQAKVKVKVKNGAQVMTIDNFFAS